MESKDVAPGIRVKVVSCDPLLAKEMLIPAYYKINRRRHAIGVVTQAVPGHGGDVWFVKHLDDKTAPYVFSELARAGADDVDIKHEFELRRDVAKQRLSSCVEGSMAHAVNKAEMAAWDYALRCLERSRLLEK